MKSSLKHLLSLLLLLSVALGAVSASDLEQRSGFASPVLIANTSFLNLRVGPGTQYDILMKVAGGTPLPVLGVASDGVWYQVATDLGPAWVNVEFTIARGNFSDVPLVSFQSSSPAAASGAASAASASTSSIPSTGGGDALALGVTVESADLRAQPSGQAFIVSALFGDANTIYPLLSITSAEGFVWAQLSVPGVGAAWTDRFRLRPLGCSGVSIGVVKSTAQIRFDGIANRQTFSLDAGTEVFGLELRGSQILVQLVDTTRGLIDASQFEPRRGANVICDGVSAVTSSAPANQGQGGGAVVVQPSQASTSVTGNRAIVNTGNLNVRSGPSAAFSVVATLRGGTEIAVLGRASDDVWLLIEGAFGRGWLNREFIIFRGNYSTVPIVEDFSGSTLAPAPLVQANAPQTAVVPEQVSGNRVIINTGNLNVRSGPGAAFGSIATVRGGTELAVNGVTEDGVWYLVSGSFGQGWVNSEFVIFRGNYSIIPIVSY